MGIVANYRRNNAISYKETLYYREIEFVYLLKHLLDIYNTLLYYNTSRI
jgi:hypothetical protein